MPNQPVPLILVIDVGTTNIKCLVFDRNLQIVYRAVESIAKIQPEPGWVEQDPITMLEVVDTLVKAALEQWPSVPAIGITNQRETVVVWNKQTGRPYYRAILWEDSRTAEECQRLAKNQELVEIIRQKTGLTISPYFSASKMAWLEQNFTLDHKTTAFGTIDSWLIYSLTGNHYTDYTNASRTLLFNIHDLAWDDILLEPFSINRAYLPQAMPSRTDFGQARAYRQLPILSVIADQQASLYAAGTQPGLLKVTYGTGIFPMKLVGDQFVTKPHFMTTLAVSSANQPQYALEGKIDNAAAQVKPVLKQPEKLKLVIQKLALQTAGLIKELADPLTKEIVVDGGISQSDTLIAEQQRLNSLPVRRLTTFEGTALGVAKLYADQS